MLLNLNSQLNKFNTSRSGGDYWRYSGCRPKRPLKSIVLDPGVKDLILNDARDFLDSKVWYQERGIPFRRGYLLVRDSVSIVYYVAHMTYLYSMVLQDPERLR